MQLETPADDSLPKSVKRFAGHSSFFGDKGNPTNALWMKSAKRSLDEVCRAPSGYGRPYRSTIRSHGSRLFQRASDRAPQCGSKEIFPTEWPSAMVPIKSRIRIFSPGSRRWPRRLQQQSPKDNPSDRCCAIRSGSRSLCSHVWLRGGPWSRSIRAIRSNDLRPSPQLRGFLC